MQKFRFMILAGILSFSTVACGIAQDTSNAITNNNTNEAPVINIVNDVSKLVDSSAKVSSETSAETPAETTTDPVSDPAANPNPDTGNLETVSNDPAKSTGSSPAQPSNECVFQPDAKGNLSVPFPDGGARILRAGEYNLLDNGKSVRVTKPGQIDTGKVREKICEKTTTVASFCDRFPSNSDGAIMVPYNDKERYLAKGEFELQPDQHSIRVTKTGAPDFGKVITPPACKN